MLLLTFLCCASILVFAALIAWSFLAPICVHLSSSAVKFLRPLSALAISLPVFAIYAVAIAAAELWKWARLRWDKFVFRLFGAVDCHTCRKCIRRPLLWLARDKVPGTNVKFDRISHTYCARCFADLTAQFRRDPTGKGFPQIDGGRDLRAAGDPSGFQQTVNSAGRGMRANSHSGMANPRPA